jgi:pilus assembly protein Flp/PilA
MIISLLKGLSKDEDGATLLEYTVLLGLVLTGGVAVIGLFGAWIDDQWTWLIDGMNAADGGASGGSGGSSGGSGGGCIRGPPLC